MRTALVYVLLTFFVGLVLHVFLGWEWTILAAVAGGYGAGGRGWLVGCLGLGSEWLAIVAYNFAVAWRPTQELARLMGELLGNMPGSVFVGLSVLLGVALGGLGGLIGSQLALLRPER